MTVANLESSTAADTEALDTEQTGSLRYCHRIITVLTLKKKSDDAQIKTTDKWLSRVYMFLLVIVILTHVSHFTRSELFACG